MFNFGSRAEWGEGRRVSSSSIDVDTTKDQCHLLNPTPLDCITGYIMEDAISDTDLNSMPDIRLKFIDGCISSYCSVINSPERPE